MFLLTLNGGFLTQVEGRSINKEVFANGVPWKKETLFTNIGGKTPNNPNPLCERKGIWWKFVWIKMEPPWKENLFFQKGNAQNYAQGRKINPRVWGPKDTENLPFFLNLPEKWTPFLPILRTPVQFLFGRNSKGVIPN